MNKKIQITSDGSHTLFVPELNEHYHSVNGAIQESMHVFIETGFHHCSKNKINIFEVGFGTGLNAYLTLLDINKKEKEVYYTSIEKYPLDLDLIKHLNYTNQLGYNTDELYLKIHQSDWNTNERVTSNFYLKKIEADFTTFDFSLIKSVDIVYFDAFAPDKQNEMWSQDLFDNLYNVMNTGGILVTYCAKGVIRRKLQQSGFSVERLPGPPGKREMLRAIK